MFKWKKIASHLFYAIVSLCIEQCCRIITKGKLFFEQIEFNSRKIAHNSIKLKKYEKIAQLPKIRLK